MARPELNAFSLQFNRADSTVIVRVSGEVDCATAPQLQEALLDLIDAQGNLSVCVDLAGTTFIDSSGLRALVSGLLHIRKRGGVLTLAKPSPSVLRVLDIVGFTKVFDISQDGVAVNGDGDGHVRRAPPSTARSAGASVV